MSDDQLASYLRDVHAIELQALEQMRFAPRVAGDPGLAAAFREHFAETEDHERRVRATLEARGAGPSALKDAAGRAGGWGMILFARLNPDSPGKLAMHAYAYEHMELAAYELLGRVADRADDDAVRELAASIGAEERAMAGRIEDHWDGAVAASLTAKGADDLQSEIVKYLRDAYALESQALQLLDDPPALEPLARVFADHAEETREHRRLVEARLHELGSGPGRFQAGAMRISALNLGGFFAVQPDTATKLAGFAYAFEALEAGAYKLLARAAQRADDEPTEALARRILAEERAAAERIAGTWDAAVAVNAERRARTSRRCGRVCR